jgi:hypothetical protein
MEKQKSSSKGSNEVYDLTQNPHSHSQSPEANTSTKASKPKKSKPFKSSKICESVRELELKVQEIKKQLALQSHPKDYSKVMKNFKKSEKLQQIKYEKEKIERYNKKMQSKILISSKHWTKSRKPFRKEGFSEDCKKISDLLNTFDDEILKKFIKILTKRSELLNFNYFEPDMQISEDVSLELNWLELKEDNFFRGEMKNGQPDGRGVLLNKSQLYEGYFENGVKQGLGRQVTSSKVYTGYWVNDEYSGFGTLVKKTSVYSGEFEFGTESGFGILKRKEARYEGSWKLGKQHGNGIIRFDDGRIYKGEFADGAIKGYGSIIWPSGKSLVGYWENGEIVGNPQKVYLKIEEIPVVPLDEVEIEGSRSEQGLSDEVKVDNLDSF